MKRHEQKLTDVPKAYTIWGKHLYSNCAELNYNFNLASAALNHF